MHWVWPDAATLVQSFVPDTTQAVGLIAVFATGLIMIVLGRLMLGRRILPEVALIAGWGLVSLVLTLWGVQTTQSMAIPAVLLVTLGCAAALFPRGRLGPEDLTSIGRLLLIALPLIMVFAAAYPSQPDTFTNQLPNAAYLHDYGKFPGIGRPPMLAVWPAFPYNLQLAALIPSLIAPDFPIDILTHVNLLLQLALALLLARTLRAQKLSSLAAPSWPAIAGGVLLVTFLNPGFNPKIQISGYSDPAIMVAVAFAAWQAERLLAVLASDESPAPERLTLTFVLLAGVAIKQVSVFLMVCIVVAAVLIGIFDRRIGPAKAISSFIPALVPAILLVGVWRFYVGSHFAPDDELRLLPFAQWSFDSLPAILSNMLLRIWQRLPFFVLLYGVSLASIPILFRRRLAQAGRLSLITLIVTVLYTAFLVFTYIAHFPGEIGASAHSFFRYNLHLGMLAMLSAVAIARESWVGRGTPELGKGWSSIQIAAILLAVVTPFPAAQWLRYDLRQPQPLVWDLGRFAAPYLHDGDHVALLLPGDNSAVNYMLRVALAMTPPRHALAHFDAQTHADAATLETLRKAGNGYALISCVSAQLAASPLGKTLALTAGKAALLTTAGDGWRLLGSHAYPSDLPPVKDWTAELPPGPFCR
jgi:hypothetical protein